jgi:hypothetical protein
MLSKNVLKVQPNWFYKFRYLVGTKILRKCEKVQKHGHVSSRQYPNGFNSQGTRLGGDTNSDKGEDIMLKTKFVKKRALTVLG